MANSDDWIDVPVIAKAQAKEIPGGPDDWQDVDLPDPHEKLKGAGTAALEHFGDSASMGYLPQLQAAAEAPMTKVMDMITGQNVGDDLPEYTQRRDENIARIKEEGEAHPLASAIGTLGGVAASAIPGGAALSKLPGIARLAAARAAPGAGLAARAAALAGRTGAAAGAAGLQGLIANPGDTEGEVDPLQIEDRAKQGLIGATVGAPLHMGGEGLSTVGRAISDRFKNKASDLAFRALGPFKRQVNQNRDEVREIGREALDSGVIKWPPTNASGLEQRASLAAGESGKSLGDLTDRLSALENEATHSGMSRKQIAENLRKELLSENPSQIPGLSKRNESFDEMIGEFEGAGPQNLSFKDLRSAKQAVQGTKDQEGLINWNRLRGADIPQEEQFHRALATQLRQGEESGADAIEKAYYGKESNQLKTLKDQFGRRQTAAQIAGNRADAQKANQILGLKDAIYGSGGATLGGLLGYQLDGTEGAKAGAALGGSVGALGNKLARDYGSQVSAKTLDAVSKLAAKSPMIQKILERNPTFINQLIQSIELKENRKKK